MQDTSEKIVNIVKAILGCIGVVASQVHEPVSEFLMVRGQSPKIEVMSRSRIRDYPGLPTSMGVGARHLRGAGNLFEQMVLYARKAVSLDPRDADAHAALGYALTLTGDLKQGQAQLDEALRLSPNSFDNLIFYACLAEDVQKEAEAADRAIAVNPAYPKWAIPCLRLGLVMAGRYEDVIRVQSRQPEDEWNTDGFVIVAGSLAALGKKDEAGALAKRGVAKFPGLLSIERFALNRSWPPDGVKVMSDLMRKAGFPACATAQELADTPNPVRLPECAG